jgi:HlyD family secretion protein
MNSYFGVFGLNVADGLNEAGESVTIASPWIDRQSVVRAVRDGVNRFAAAQGGTSISLDFSGHPELASRIEHSYKIERRVGLKVLAIAGCVVFGLGGLAPMSGAVVAVGLLIAETNVKRVQHPTGGVVAQIAAQDGMRVKTGDLLVRLDDTQTRANLQILSAQFEQVSARIARLVSERDGREDMQPSLVRSGENIGNDISQLLESEKSSFKARAVSRRSQKEALQSHISQLGKQISGIEAQLTSGAREVELITSELKGLQTLYEKKLVALPRLNSLQRDAARLQGEHGRQISAIAEAESKISETELQIARIDQDFRTEVMKELREAQDKSAELAERIVVAKDQLLRIDIRSPASGYVHQLTTHTIGGVITPADVLMEIVPDNEDLQIEARVQPKDIDHVKQGQKAVVRLSAFGAVAKVVGIG